MYKVLLVDDEPLILAGIKFMINWQENGLELINTARNGQQALEIIQESQPDIVIADINMPVMDGMELLRKASKVDFPPVFIMLTNLEEFSLAREAVQFQAVDYLVKSQLEPEILQESLERAKLECRKRNDLARVSQVDRYLSSNKSQIMDDVVARAFSQEAILPETIQTLCKNEMLIDYSVIQLQFSYPAQCDDLDFSDGDRKRLFEWEKEVLQKLAKNSFEHFIMIEISPLREGLLLYVWRENREHYPKRLSEFWKKACNTSDNITRMKLCCMVTDFFQDEKAFSVCRQQVLTLRDYYYCNGGSFVNYSEISEFKNKPLALLGLPGRLKTELNSRNTAACTVLINRAINRIKSVPHEKNQALWLCSELYSVASAIFQNGEEGCDQASFSNHSTAYAAIEHLSTREEVIRWLETFKNGIANGLAASASGHVEILEKARQYVQDNVDKRILLQDVAEYACISPGYLSALFKKQYGQNFVDYINQTKINRACEFIREGKHRISEIADMLSFDNAYYFSKVFRRYMGMTPSEYKYKVRAASNG